MSCQDANPSFPHQRPGGGRGYTPHSPASSRLEGCRPTLLRDPAQPDLPSSQAPRRSRSCRPPRLRIPAPQAARRCCSAWALSARAGPVGPRRSQAWGLLSLPLRPGPSSGGAPPTPPPVRDPGPWPRLGPPGPFPPVRHSSLPGSQTRSGPPFSRVRSLLAARANTSSLRRSLPCPSVRRSTSLAPEDPLVSSLLLP